MKRKTGVNLSSLNAKRFKRALEVRNVSMHELARRLEKEDAETGITLRSIQRNLKAEQMRTNVLDTVCRVIDVHPDYMTGDFNQLGNKNDCTDREGYIVPRYSDPLVTLVKDQSTINRTIRDSLNTYLLLRQFRVKRKNKYVAVGEEFFIENYADIENVVHEAVQKYIDQTLDLERIG